MEFLWRLSVAILRMRYGFEEFLWSSSFWAAMVLRFFVLEENTLLTIYIHYHYLSSHAISLLHNLISDLSPYCFSIITLYLIILASVLNFGGLETIKWMTSDYFDQWLSFANISTMISLIKHDKRQGARSSNQLRQNINFYDGRNRG
ncbi:uncharacterized protein LOC131597267 [Vicia villosa]|uniref:uncharacterized protein LOC131597267 n=1 Tax=Vicia villosa TaxID=3911 RepID=UPI00273CEBC4|nr:uncharacterized protein LOC131597267 [Vicia villosa]